MAKTAKLGNKIYTVLSESPVSGTVLLQMDCPRVVSMGELDDYETACVDCGKTFPVDDMEMTVDGYVCSDCFVDNYTQCDHCGEIIRRDDATYIESEDIDLCDSCRDEAYSYCDYCGKWHRREELTTVGNREYCDDCIQELDCTGTIQRCDNCGNYIPADEGHYVGYDNRFLCNDCFEDCEDISHIDGYHCSRDPWFRSLNSETTAPLSKNTYIGVEHELSCVGEKNYDLAEILTDDFGRKCEEDSSIWEGFECISDAQTFLYWKERENIDAYMETCVNEGLYPDLSSGIHVHISRNNGLDDEAVMRIVKFVFSNYGQCLKFGRRCPDKIDYCEFLDLDKHDDWLWQCQSNRYYAVNLEHESNLELRFFTTTDSAAHFWAIIEFAHCLAEVSKEEGEITWERLKQYAIDDGKCEHFLDELNNDFDCPEVVDYDYDIAYEE